MSTPDTIGEYLRLFATELGERILQHYPPLHGIEDGFSPLVRELLRKPFPAQTDLPFESRVECPFIFRWHSDLGNLPL
jgi:hypothetical protein